MPDPLGPITAGRRGRGLWSFRLGPIPVSIHLSFLLVLGFLGLGLGDPLRIGIWIVVGAASVLLHELGHAVGALAAGYQPRVDLAGMGGVTSYVPDREQSRGWGLLITGAGPAVQILAGVAVLPFVGFGIDLRGDLVAFAGSVWVVVSLLWGVLNLVPILPLDGGQLLRNLVPGDARTRTRVAEAVSVAFAAAGLLWGLATGQTIVALLSGWFGFANIQSLLAGQDDRVSPQQDLLDRAREALAAGDPLAAADHAGAASQASADRRMATLAATVSLSALLQAGQDRRAYRVASDPRPGLALDEVRVAEALARHPDGAAVWDVLAAASRTNADARLRSIAAVFAAFHGQSALAGRVVASGPVSMGAQREVDRLRPR